MKIDHEPKIYEDLEIIFQVTHVSYISVLCSVPRSSTGTLEASQSPLTLRRMYCFTAQTLTNVYGFY